MKRLILINILLAMLIHYLPTPPTMENKTILATEQQIIQEDKKEISSRSLDTARDSIEENQQEILFISETAIEYIKSKEGFSPIAYYNNGEDALTIGYGHKDKKVKINDTITKEQAERLLIADLQGYFDYVINYCSYLELNQNEIDMLVCFAYNCGCGNLNKLTANKTRNKQEIAEHWTSYTSKNPVFKKGLLKRRQEELKIFLGGYSNEE